MAEPTVRLTDGQSAIVGYGSLLSMASIGRTLGRAYDGPFVYAHVDGWRRSWDAGMPNSSFYFEEAGARIYPASILYLNVRPDPATSINCAIFVVRPDEIAKMDERERIYDRRDVTGIVRGARVEGGPAYMYVARAEHVLRGARAAREACVRASYLRLVDSALATAGPAFRREYERTTDPVPVELVREDLLAPRAGVARGS